MTEFSFSSPDQAENRPSRTAPLLPCIGIVGSITRGELVRQTRQAQMVFVILTIVPSMENSPWETGFSPFRIGPALALNCFFWKITAVKPGCCAKLRQPGFPFSYWKWLKLIGIQSKLLRSFFRYLLHILEKYCMLFLNLSETILIQTSRGVVL